MKRTVRKEIKDHIALSDQLVASLLVWGEYFKHAPIGFDTLYILVNAQNLLTGLKIYSYTSKEKLKYKKRKRK